MKNSILFNALWIAIAAATFAIGRMTAGSGDEPSAAAEGSNQSSALSSIVKTNEDELPPARRAPVEESMVNRPK